MKMRLAIVGCLLAVPIAAGVGSVAFADPSGCSASTDQFYLQGNSSLAAQGSGSCSSSANRNLQVEIKHDISFQTDPVVTHGNDVTTGTYYSVFVESCDNGNYATYYGRTFFTTNTTYHDSAHHTYQVC